MGWFDEEFIKSMPDDSPVAFKMFIDQFDSLVKRHDNMTDRINDYDNYLDAIALLRVFCGVQGIFLQMPEIQSDKGGNIASIIRTFGVLRGEIDKRFTLATSEKYRALLETKFGMQFVYEFSEGDLKKMQSLIDELRNIIAESPLFEEDHKLRLLRRLEKLQTELHKKMSDLDRFWGFVGDAGVIIGKFGNDVKPIIDRINEIIKIVWSTQSRAEELPSNYPVPQIPHEDKDKE